MANWENLGNGLIPHHSRVIVRQSHPKNVLFPFFPKYLVTIHNTTTMQYEKIPKKICRLS